jgi:hypothetical protein
MAVTFGVYTHTHTHVELKSIGDELIDDVLGNPC